MQYATIKTIINRNALFYPDRPALIQGARRYTFSQYRDRTFCLGNALLSKGLEKGDRIAILSENNLEYEEIYLGVPSAGLVAVPLNYRLAPLELVTILSDCEPSVLVVQDKFMMEVKEIKDSLPSTIKEIIFLGEKENAPAGWHVYEDLLSQSSPADPSINIDEDDLAVIMYTSGTTGLPKGVMITHGNCYHIGRSFNHALDYIRGAHVLLCTFPNYHIAGLGACLMCSYYLGWTIVMLPSWNVVDLLKLIEQEEISLVGLPLPQIVSLVEDSARDRHDLSSLKLIYTAGGPVPSAVYKKVLDSFGNVLSNIYGITEATGATLALRPSDIEAALAKGKSEILSSCGKPMIDMENMVVDEEGKKLPPGEIGELIIGGLGITCGYWRKDKETQETFRGGWLYTGDLAKVDEEGYYYIIDRKKDMIITGGENVYAIEVENVLYQHPAIAEAAVIGVPDEKWGERVHAVVVLKPGKQLTLEEMIQFCRGKLAGYKIPRSVEYLSELPRNLAGKVMKTELRAKNR